MLHKDNLKRLFGTHTEMNVVIRTLGYLVSLAGFVLIIWQVISSPFFDLKLRQTCVEMGSPLGAFVDGELPAKELSHDDAIMLLEQWRSEKNREAAYVVKTHIAGWGAVMMLFGTWLPGLSEMRNKRNKAEQHAGQVSSETAQSATPNEPPA